MAQTDEIPEETTLDNGEKIVHDKDDDGKVIGWHKEAPKEDK